MNRYTKALEDLDARVGRVHTIDDWRRLGEKSAAELTDDDLIIIEGFDGKKSAAEGRARREKALGATADPPATVTKSDRSGMRPDEVQALINGIAPVIREEFAKRDARIEAFEQRAAGAETSRANIEQRCAALELRNKELEGRLLELEASVSHVV